MQINVYTKIEGMIQMAFLLWRCMDHNKKMWNMDEGTKKNLAFLLIWLGQQKERTNTMPSY